MIEPEDLGARLRAFRLGRGLTLQAAGALCGVGASTLSKIENGQALPAYGTLKRIAEGLDLSFEELISGRQGNQASARRSTTRRSETLKFQSDRYDYHVHATDLVRKAMIPLEMEIRATAPPGRSGWSSHDGEEFIYVLSGEIEVYLDEYATFHLRTGESAYIDSHTPHAFVALGETPARMLSICFDPKHQTRTANEFIKDSATR